MAEPLRHRQTKEAATDMFGLKPPRHISTLPIATGTYALNFRPVLGALRTWIDARPRSTTTRMTQLRHRLLWIAAAQNEHEPDSAGRNFFDLIGCVSRRLDAAP